MHPAAPHHLPHFITAPGETDTLMVFATVLVIVGIMTIGVLFFRLHSLPERMGHKKFQFEIVAVLTLLSLFTHVHLFWVAGLLLALIDFPDFVTPLRRMSRALEKLAGIESPPETEPAVEAAHKPEVPQAPASPASGLPQTAPGV